MSLNLNISQGGRGACSPDPLGVVALPDRLPGPSTLSQPGYAPGCRQLEHNRDHVVLLKTKETNE